ncbi:unnamed protein product, partial [Allacma fusca]
SYFQIVCRDPIRMKSGTVAKVSTEGISFEDGKKATGHLQTDCINMSLSTNVGSALDSAAYMALAQSHL